MLIISTREYRLSHGKEPRGRGHWAFFFDHHDEIDSAMWYQGTYRQALTMARRYAVTKGFTYIEVGS